MKSLKKNLLVLSTVLLINTCAFAQFPPAQWAIGTGSGGNDMPYGISVDPSGNVITAGDFAANVDFDPGPAVYSLSTISSIGSYVLKVDAAGSLVWAKMLCEGYPGQVRSVATDTNGNILVGGTLAGTTDVNPGSGTYTLDIGTFVLKLDPSGNFLWAKGMTCNGQLKGVGFDPQGNAYATGIFQGIGDLNASGSASSITAVGQADAFIIKYTAAGNFVYARGMGGSGIDIGYSITGDISGNAIIGGSFSNTVDIDPGTPTVNLVAAGSNDAFVLKYDALGNYVWGFGVGSLGYDDVYGVTVNAGGEVFITGAYMYTVDLDPGATTSTVSSAGLSDAFVMKVNANGQYQWAKKMGSSGNDYGYGIALDVNGNVLVAGTHNTTVNLNPGTTTSTFATNGTNDMFISQFSPTGAFMNGGTMGTTSVDEAFGIATDKTDGIYVCGAFMGTGDFDPGTGVKTLVTNGSRDALCLKLSNCATPANPASTTPTTALSFCRPGSATLTANGTGTLQWFNSATSTSVIISGTLLATPNYTAAGQYTYYVEAALCNKSPMRTAITVTVLACVGVDESLRETSFSVYPNPSTGEIYLLSEVKDTIEIYNAAGQMVQSIEVVAGGITQVSSLAGGLYFLKNISAKGSFRKLIVAP